MKIGMDLNSLAAEITRQADVKRDFKAPTGELTVSAIGGEGDGETIALKVNGHGEFTPTANAHNQLGAWAGIPSKYYDKMHAEAPELLADNLNHWFSATKETRLVRTLDGRARAFLSNRYRTIDNFQVAEAVLPIFVENGNKLGLRIESMNVTENRLYIKAISERVTGTVVGERVQSGIVISNSEVGLHAFKIEPLVYVLSCTNGAIMNDAAMRRYHVGRASSELEFATEVFADDTRKADDDALRLKMRDVVIAAFDQVRFAKTLETVSFSGRRTITRSISEAVNVAVEVLNVPERHATGILDALAKKYEATQWGLSNAVTLYAQNDSLSYDEATDLERVGGEILTLSESKWKAIAAA